MSRTSLLFFDSESNCHGNISFQVFEDVCLTKLLQEQTIKILQTPCSRGEIAARQKLFAELDDSGFREAFVFLSQSLTSLKQSHKAYKNASNLSEKLLLFRRFAQKYAQTLSAAAALKSGSPFGAAFADYISALPAAELAGGLEATGEDFAQISSFGLRFAPAAAAVSEIPDDAEENFIGQILECAAGLGFEEISQPLLREVRINNDLSDALIKLFRKQFDALGAFEQKFSTILDESIIGYRAEIDFYLSVYELAQRASKNGIAVCFPDISDRRVFRARNAYDVSLLVKNCDKIVPNDIDFSESDNVYFLTGANGGGKTTYLRTVAVNLLLALGGCPVFCESAEIYPFTAVFTHFTADERFTDSGRFVEEQKRVGGILAAADAGSFVLLNETFSGTDEKKGEALTLETAQKLQKLGSFALYVTHFHEVNGRGIPMLNTVIDDSDENRRTYKIVKSSESNSSYAYDILKKYRLTKEALAKRLGEYQ